MNYTYRESCPCGAVLSMDKPQQAIIEPWRADHAGCRKSARKWNNRFPAIRALQEECDRYRMELESIRREQ